MRLHELLDVGFFSPPNEVVQKRLIGIDGVNQGAELLRQRYRLASSSATDVDDDSELLPRKKSKDVQCIGVAAWAEFLHTTE
jgi:hypothetical protein